MLVHTQHGQTREQGYFSSYVINPLKTPLKFSAVFTWPGKLDITQRFLAGFYLEHTTLLMAYCGLLFYLRRKWRIQLKLPAYPCIFVLFRKLRQKQLDKPLSICQRQNTTPKKNKQGCALGCSCPIDPAFFSIYSIVSPIVF